VAFTVGVVTPIGSIAAFPHHTASTAAPVPPGHACIPTRPVNAALAWEGYPLFETTLNRLGIVDVNDPLYVF
jgi:hypothetical protein